MNEDEPLFVEEPPQEPPLPENGMPDPQVLPTLKKGRRPHKPGECKIGGGDFKGAWHKINRTVEPNDTYETCVNKDGDVVWNRKPGLLPQGVKLRMMEEFVQKGYTIKALAVRWGFTKSSIMAYCRKEKWMAKRALWNARMEIKITTPQAMPFVAEQFMPKDTAEAEAKKFKVNYAQYVDHGMAMTQKLMKDLAAAIESGNGERIKKIGEQTKIANTLLERQRIILRIPIEVKERTKKEMKAAARVDLTAVTPIELPSPTEPELSDVP